MTKLKTLPAALLAAALVTACGGGGGDSTPTPAPAPTPASTTLNGVAAKGPLKLALVTAFPVDAAGNVGSTAIASATTTASGSYSLNLGTYAGAVQLVVTATADTRTADEATGTDVPLPTSFRLRANTVVPAATAPATQAASVTPFTELAHNIAAGAGGLTPANISNANGVVFALIGVDPVATQPVAANAAPPAGATEAEKRYGLFNAAISQLASSAPATTDATTVACFGSAGTDLGLKIQCATQQIATAVSVSGSGSSAVSSVNDKLVGLSGALVAVAADTTINKTGAVIAASDSAVQTLTAVETAAAAGNPPPISGGGSSQSRSDVALAKQFFSTLRANAAALESGAVDTGISDGVKAFSDALSQDVTAVTQNTADVLQLTDIALTLWLDFTAGATTNPNSVPVSGLSGGCTVFQGAFPTGFGGDAGAAGQPYATTSTTATGPGNAAWVGCSVNSGPLLSDGSRRYRQSILLNFGADSTFARVPWLAVTRAQFVEGGVTYQQNLTPSLTGIAGLTLTNGEVSGISLVGDLPPATTPGGQLLAARYPVNFTGSISQLASGAAELRLSGGSFGVVPVGGSAASLTVDLSSGGASAIVVPVDATVAAQVAASKLTLAATITTPKGRLVGEFVADRFVVDPIDGPLPTHGTFTGTVSVAPVVGGTTGALVGFLAGTLEYTDGARPVTAFSGRLTLPNRPEASLTLSITQTGVNDLTAEGRYVQNGVTVNINGTESATSQSFTFADSTGVSVTVTSSSAAANVTVSGRQTAVIQSNRITYSDGTFESLI